MADTISKGLHPEGPETSCEKKKDIDQNLYNDHHFPIAFCLTAPLKELVCRHLLLSSHHHHRHDFVLGKQALFGGLNFMFNSAKIMPSHFWTPTFGRGADINCT